MSDKIGRGRGMGGCLLAVAVLILAACYLAYRRGVGISEIFRRFLNAIGL
jgi:hypothetical protein